MNVIIGFDAKVEEAGGDPSEVDAVEAPKPQWVVIADTVHEELKVITQDCNQHSRGE